MATAGGDGYNGELKNELLLSASRAAFVSGRKADKESTLLNEIYHAIDPIIFSIGPVSVRWYGLAYLAAFMLGAYLIYRIARHWKLQISSDDVLTFIISVAFGVILGARLGYCLFYGDGYYFAHPLDILNFSLGGMSFHGGLIGAFIGGAAAAKITHVPFLTWADLGAIVAPIGLFFGRCANFINGELWGSVTDLPWGVVFDDTGGGLLARHPTQLYEAILEGLVIFVVLFVLARKAPARPRGTFIGVFMVMYGIFRTAIEFVRQPDVQLGYLYGDWLTMGMVLSFPVFIVGVCVLVYFTHRSLPQEGRGDSTPAVIEGRESDASVCENKNLAVDEGDRISDAQAKSADECVCAGGVQVKSADEGDRISDAQAKSADESDCAGGAQAKSADELTSGESLDK